MKCARLLSIILLLAIAECLALQPMMVIYTVNAAHSNWLSGYLFRKSQLILSAAGAGTNYQVQFTVYYASGTDGSGALYVNSGCKPGFGDIAFTDSTETALLDYWMQAKVDSSYAIFWVEIAGSLTSTNQTIYMYYGNLAATTLSNFDNTFVFGELFDSATLNTTTWSSVDGNPTYTISSSSHYLEVTTMDTSNWWNGKGFHSRTFVFPSQYIIEDAYSSLGQQMSLYIEASGNIFGGLFSAHHASYSGSDFGIAYSKIRKDGDSDFKYSKQAGVGGNDYDWSSGLLTGQAQNWYDLRTRIWKLSTNATAEVDGTVRANETSAETPDRMHLGIARTSPNLFGTIRFYAFKVRQYTSPEPAYGAVSTETQYTLGDALPNIIAATSLISVVIIFAIVQINRENVDRTVVNVISIVLVIIVVIILLTLY